MRISYASLFKFLIAFYGPSGDIENVDIFFCLETLLLIYDTADNIELGADDEYNFVSIRKDGLPRVQLDNIDDSCRSAFHHKS